MGEDGADADGSSFPADAGVGGDATELEVVPVLEAFGLDPDAPLEFKHSESGWSASTRSEDVAYRCSANEVSASFVGEDGQLQLDCAPVDTAALRLLRARYDSERS